MRRTKKKRKKNRQGGTADTRYEKNKEDAEQKEENVVCNRDGANDHQ